MIIFLEASFAYIPDIEHVERMAVRATEGYGLLIYQDPQ